MCAPLKTQTAASFITVRPTPLQKGPEHAEVRKTKTNPLSGFKVSTKR